MKNIFNVFCYTGFVGCSVWTIKTFREDQVLQMLIASFLAIAFLLAYDRLFASYTKEEALEEANKALRNINIRRRNAWR